MPNEATPDDNDIVVRAPRFDDDWNIAIAIGSEADLPASVLEAVQELYDALDGLYAPESPQQVENLTCSEVHSCSQVRTCASYDKDYCNHHNTCNKTSCTPHIHCGPLFFFAGGK